LYAGAIASVGDRSLVSAGDGKWQMADGKNYGIYTFYGLFIAKSWDPPPPRLWRAGPPSLKLLRVGRIGVWKRAGEPPALRMPVIAVNRS